VVWAPEQVLTKESYSRRNGKRRYLLLLEETVACQTMSLSEFRTRIRRSVPQLDQSSPRTRPIVENDQADAILRLWTVAGRVLRSRSAR